MMNLETLQTAVLIWANEKGIVKRENALKQLLKFDEESGELSGSVLKNNHDLLVDSVGDTLVTLTILAADLSYNLKISEIDKMVSKEISGHISSINYCRELVRLKGLLAVELDKEILQACIHTTLEISYNLGLNPTHCLETAYNVIAKRKGKTINGNFIKEEDLPCEQ